MKKPEKLVVIKTMITKGKTDQEILDYSKSQNWQGNISNYIKEVKDNTKENETKTPDTEVTETETPPIGTPETDVDDIEVDAEEVAPTIEKDENEVVADNGKPRKINKKILTITKIIRNMKGGATLSFKGKNDDIVVDSSAYKVGDDFEISVKSKKKK